MPPSRPNPLPILGDRTNSQLVSSVSSLSLTESQTLKSTQVAPSPVTDPLKDLPPPEWVLVMDNGIWVADNPPKWVKKVFWKGRWVIVKFGFYGIEREFEIMRFVKANTEVPVAEVYAVAYHKDETFLYMEYVDGTTLCNSKEQIREAIAPQALDYIKQLRQLRMPPTAQIGNFPAAGHSRYMRVLGPYYRGSVFKQTPVLKTTRDFKRWLIADMTPRVTASKCYNRKDRPRIIPHLESLDPDAPIVFTHGDLHTGNVLHRDGKIVAIIDWEMAGWYPEWLEAQVIGHYRADDYKDRMKAFADVMGVSAAGEGWDSPYIWRLIARRCLQKEECGVLEWEEEVGEEDKKDAVEGGIDDAAEDAADLTARAWVVGRFSGL